MPSQAQEYWERSAGSEPAGPIGPEFAGLRKDIIAQYGKDSVRKSWLQVTKLLEKEKREIVDAGSSAWPEIVFEDLSAAAQTKADEIRHKGVVAIRNVFPDDQARKWLSSLDNYLQQNSMHIPGQPDPCLLFCFIRVVN